MKVHKDEISKYEDSKGCFLKKMEFNGKYRKICYFKISPHQLLNTTKDEFHKR